MIMTCVCISTVAVCFAMNRWAQRIASEHSDAAVKQDMSESSRVRKFIRDVKALKAGGLKALKPGNTTISRSNTADAAPSAGLASSLAAPHAFPSAAHITVTFNSDAWDAPKPVRMRLLPEYSSESVAFMREASVARCPGELYRSESRFLIQGRFSCGGGKTTTRVVKGGCPAGVTTNENRKCPSHDPQCGCHGPLMTRGMGKRPTVPRPNPQTSLQCIDHDGAGCCSRLGRRRCWPRFLHLHRTTGQWSSGALVTRPYRLRAGRPRRRRLVASHHGH